MKGPIVSIVTPAWNAAEHIAETASSVMAQTYPHWEWIIADDGSSDATCAVVGSIGDERVRLIESPHSGLPAVGRNRAVNQARGAFIAYLDADDLWLPQKLERQLAFFEAHPDTGLVFTKVRYLWDAAGRIGRRAEPPTSGLPNPAMLFRTLCAKNLVPTSSVLVRRSVLDDLGPMDESPEQRGTEDYELWLRLARHVPFGWLEEPLVWYRVNEKSLSGRAVPIARGAILAVEKAIRRESEPVAETGLTPRAFEALRFFRLGHAEFRDRMPGFGRRNLLRAALFRPANVSAWVWLILSLFGSWTAKAVQIVERYALSRPLPESRRTPRL